MEMGISFSADGHFHGVVYLLITLQKRKKETEEAQNVVLMILLEIKFNVAVRLVAILDTICQQKKEPGAQPRSQGPLSFSFLEVEKPLERGCQGQGFCELFTRAFSLQILFNLYPFHSNLGIKIFLQYFAYILDNCF